MTAAPSTFRFVSSNRRVREDRRFVAGQGRYVADIALEGMLHVAVLPSQHPAARIVSIETSAALAMPGVHYVLTGDELAGATDQLMNGLDTPHVKRFPLAVGQTRYAGEWVAAVVAEVWAAAAELPLVTCRALPAAAWMPANGPSARAGSPCHPALRPAANRAGPDRAPPAARAPANLPASSGSRRTSPRQTDRKSVV